MRQFKLTFAACFAGGLAALAAAPVPAAAQSIAIEDETEFTRIIFTLPFATGATGEIENGVLVVRFGAPYTGDLDAAAGAPGVAAARLDPNGRTARFALRDPFRLHQSQSEDLVAFDLLPASFSGDPDDIISAAEAQERSLKARLSSIVPRQKPERGALAFAGLQLPLRIDVSENDGYSRILFAWTEAVGYTVAPTGDGVEIVFDEAAAPQLTRLRVDPPPFIEGADYDILNGRLSIDLALADGAGVRHFHEGAGVVLDVLESGPIEAARVETPLIAAPSVEADLAPIVSNVGGESAAAAATSPFDMAADEGVLRVAYQPVGDNLRLLFSESVETPAAFFRRGDYLWAVFSKDLTPDVADPSVEYRSFLKKVYETTSPGATVLRFHLAKYALAAVSTEGGRWSVGLGESISAPAAPLTVKRETRASAVPQVRISLENAADILWIEDPEIGDRLAVVTAPAPARAVVTSRNFVEFIVHSAAHGAFIQPLSDDLAVEKDEAGVSVYGLSTLSLNRDIPPALAMPRGPSLQSPAFVDFKRWKAVEGNDFADMEQRLNSLVARRIMGFVSSEQTAEAAPAGIVLSGDDRAAERFGARVSLIRALYAQAKFYVAHEMGAEAMGALDLILDQDESEKTRAEFLALKGAASVMMGRYQDAIDAFSDSAFIGDRNADLWRGLAHNGLRAYARARRDLQDGTDLTALYPPQWRSRFQLALANAAVQANDVAGAKFYVADLVTGELSDDQIAEKQRIEADILRLSARLEEALEIYRRIEASQREPHASWAAYWETKLQHRTGDIDTDEAMNRLAAQQFRWRGDDLELRILNELARLYIEKGEYREGLLSMRALVEEFPSSDVAVETEADMNRIFTALFLDGRSAALDPVSALGLFYENLDLVPSGQEGDKIIQQLTERLVAFDLLPQAAELLEHQVQNRLRGVPRSRTASDLAVVYLLDQKPQQALTIIRSTRQTRLPAALNRERRIVEAQALAGLERYTHAIELLDLERGYDVDLLRGEIFWKMEDWSNSGLSFEASLGDLWREEEAFTDGQRMQVLKAAIAFALEGDQGSLNRLYSKFSEKLADTPESASFALVAQGVDAAGVRFREVASQVAAADLMDAFLAGYKERFYGGETAG